MNIHTIRHGFSTAYLIDDAGRLMLIDTSVPGTAPSIMAKINEVGGELSLIVLTHCHYDHSGSAGAVRERTGAKIGIHRLDAPQLRQGGLVTLEPTGTVPRIMKRFLGGTPIPPTEPDFEFEDTEELSEFGGFGNTFWTPGHTPGSQSVLLPDGSIIAGDALAGGFIRPAHAHGPMFVTDTSAARQSITDIARRATNGVWVAHGGHLRQRSLDDLSR
ncbi:MBL fold metallo-hydrolase [Glaciihabitans sp. UYNi722]|uniref:MBL fold metallo-hydrolase n=1 Tax=Glaciihabitans sp. UYNi722 TaxID=3156344 RepID=UPI003399ACA4